MPEQDLLRKRLAIRRWVWLGYWAILFVLTHVPQAQNGGKPLVVGIDKVVHVCAYFVLAALGGWYLSISARGAALGRLISWAAVFVAYGAIDEWLQRFVPGRTPSWWDFSCDVAGVVLAVVVVWVLVHKPWQRLSEPD